VRANYDVLMLVMNGIESDSRVIRTARTAIDCDLRTLVLGLGKAQTEAGDAPRRVAIPGLDAYTIPAPILPPAVPGTAAQGTRHRKLLRHYEDRVIELCGEMTPRVIHSHDMTTIAAGGRLAAHYSEAGRPTKWVHDLHEWVGGLTTIAEPIRLVAEEDEQEWIRRADRLTTVSPAIADIIAHEYQLAREPDVILNTPPLREFDEVLEPTVRSAIGLPDVTPLVIYCGQVKEARGVHDLVAALARLPGIHLAIVSNNKGPYVEALSQRAAADGTHDRLHLLPYVDQRHVASYMRTADLGVHPLMRYGNGDVALPNKLFEYIHAGLPVVVSDCRAMAAFVEQHRIGQSYDSGDIDGMARQIQTVLANRTAISEHVAATRLAYTWEEQERHLRAIYADLLGVASIASGPPFGWPAPTPADALRSDRMRILHGVAGSANQPWALAAALRRRGHAAHNVVTAVPRLGFRASILIPWRRMSVSSRFDLVRSLTADFDVFHLHARSFFLERGNFRFPSFVDLLLLRLSGKVVVFHFRGSEARLASEFTTKNPFSYAEADPYGLSKAYPEDRQRKMINYIGALSNAVFVTDPELQEYVPGSVIVPRAIDLTDWRPVAAPKTARPLVVHAPTRTEIKGTNHLVAAIERLRREGLDFDFAQADNMTHEAARALYERADIIVDQLLIGWYGVLAVEGMALGKPVVSYIREDLTDKLGSPMPLAIADPITVADVLRKLITNPGARRDLGQAGRAYVERVHDADVVAEDLEERYRALLQEAPGRGADYEGIAAFVEMQADHAADTWDAVTRAATGLRGTERTLAQSVRRAKRALNTVAERGDGATARRDIAPAIRGLETGLTHLARARETLDEILGRNRPGDPDTTMNELLGDHGDIKPAIEGEPTRPSLASPPTVSAEPRAGSRRHIPSVTELTDDRWGTARAIRNLLPVGDRGWEAVGAAVVRDPSTGLDLFASIAQAEHGPDRDAMLAQLAITTARAFSRDGNRLLVGGDAATAARSADANAQVRFARHYYNLRTQLGRDAELIAAALLRPTLAAETASGYTALAGAADDESRTRLNELCWYFINTAAVSRTLDAAGRDVYERSLAWFADRLGLWEVPAFRTTRTTLDVRVPIRIMPKSEAPSASARLKVSLVGDPSDDEIRIFDRRSGRIRWIERTISARLDRPAGWDIELRGPRRTVVSIDMPRYAFDPRRSTPRVGDWQSLATIELTRPVTVSHLQIDADVLGRGPGLTPFEVVGDRYTSRTLERQIEQLTTLERLHQGHEFGERAARWHEFVVYWAGQPVSD
jgi:glycosyltransferase involved in cell wall biosynthesis